MVELSLQSQAVTEAPTHAGVAGSPQNGVNTREVPEPTAMSCVRSPPSASI